MSQSQNVQGRTVCSCAQRFRYRTIPTGRFQSQYNFGFRELRLAHENFLAEDGYSDGRFLFWTISASGDRPETDLSLGYYHESAR